MATASGPGGDSGSGRSARVVSRRRIDGYTCHLAVAVADSELRDLVRTIGAPPVSGPAVLGGRGFVWRHVIPSAGAVVIKEYRRGGMLRFLRRKHYLRHGKTRPRRELETLLAARDAGLPVPDPVVSLSRGLLFYRGWLATRLIEGRSLVSVCRDPAVDLAPFIEQLGGQVRRLIDTGIAHVDLHPGNVLVDPAGTTHLIDFDRAVRFEGTREALRDQYTQRWQRAVAKHGLPPVLASGLAEALHGQALAP